MIDFFNYSMIRITFIGLIIVNFVVTIIATFMYPPLLSMPHSILYVLELGIILLVYIFLVIFITRNSTNQTIVRRGILFGLLASLLEIIHITVEIFGGLSSKAETISTGIFMFGLFIIFGITGFIITKNCRKIILGLLGGFWSGIVCMLIVMTYGLSQLFWSFHALEVHNTGNPDFIRSGWTDMHAFTIADIFEASFKILFLGPFIGMLFGFIGGSLAWILNFKNFRQIKNSNQ
jgi:hypothetical protein